MMASLTICPKCNYERQPDDGGSPDECPSCGVIYAKATPAARATGPKVPIPTAWLNEEPKEEAPRAEASLPAAAAPSSSGVLTRCGACHGPLSRQARACTHCGHPNPEAPRTAGLIAAVIAMSLGIDAALMPYFAAVFLVPATFAAAAVTAILRMRTLALIATIPAFIGLYGIYQTSKELHEMSTAAARSQSQLRMEIERVQRQLDSFPR